MQTANNKGEEKDAYQIAIDKRRKDAKDFLKKDFDIKVVNVEDIEKFGDGELIYFQYYCGMGMDDIYNDIGINENGIVSNYRKYIYDFKARKEMGPGFLAIKSFKGLEDYNDQKRFDYYYHNKYDEIDGIKNEHKLKNFEFIDLNFGNFVLINREYFDDYHNFIKILSEKYGLRESFFWVKMTTVSKIYHSKNREKFLMDNFKE